MTGHLEQRPIGIKLFQNELLMTFQKEKLGEITLYINKVLFLWTVTLHHHQD